MCRIDIHIGKLRAWGRDARPCPPDFATITPTAWKSDVPRHERGLKVLGTPLGSDDFVRAYGATIASKREQLLNYLPKLPS
eukprot:6252211-Pyramimonas_sp.AAC.1